MDVSADAVGLGAVELGMDDVGSFLVPSELFEVVPETQLYEIMVAEDETKTEWVGAVAFYPNLRDSLLQLVTKNGELVLRNVLSFLH